MPLCRKKLAPPPQMDISEILNVLSRTKFNGQNVVPWDRKGQFYVDNGMNKVRAMLNSEKTHVSFFQSLFQLRRHRRHRRLNSRRVCSRTKLIYWKLRNLPHTLKQDPIDPHKSLSNRWLIPTHGNDYKESPTTNWYLKCRPQVENQPFIRFAPNFY